jgi:hypothetical protein
MALLSLIVTCIWIITSYAKATKVGKCKYSMTEYEKLKRITVALDHLLLVTTEIYADHSKVIDSVLKLLKT